MPSLKIAFPVICSVAATVGIPATVSAAALQAVDYGGNGAVMNVYMPDEVDESPAILVALHYCGGSASNASSWFQSYADQYGFIIIAPGLPSGDADNCWDVGSSQTKTHNGGSHSKAIADMVQYAISEYGADSSRVYAAGASSGAMMTNILLGAYPDVFAAGSVLAGVPFGCWTAADGWTGECADGNVTKTAAQWGDLVRNAYSGYTGPRPRVQLFHGTSDDTLKPPNLTEEIKQWTNVFGLSETPTSSEPNMPKSGWARDNFEDADGNVVLEVARGQGIDHDLTNDGLFPDVIRFFGLDMDVVAPMPSEMPSATPSAEMSSAPSMVPPMPSLSANDPIGVPSAMASATSAGMPPAPSTSATPDPTESAGGMLPPPAMSTMAAAPIPTPAMMMSTTVPSAAPPAPSTASSTAPMTSAAPTGIDDGSSDSEGGCSVSVGEPTSEHTSLWASLLLGAVVGGRLMRRKPRDR